MRKVVKILLAIFLITIFNSCNLPGNNSIGIMITNRTSENINVFPIQNVIGNVEIDRNDNADVIIEKDQVITAYGITSHRTQMISISDPGYNWIVEW